MCSSLANGAALVVLLLVPFTPGALEAATGVASAKEDEDGRAARE
jgi:hypothetical protein